MDGISIHINPILLDFGPVAVSWHSLLMVVGIVVAVYLSARLINQAGLSVDNIYTMALIGVPSAILGARLMHVFDYWDFYMANPGRILAVHMGGLALWGGILGGILGVMIYARVKKIKIGPYADRIAPGLVLAQGIGRIGDIINGEHFSIEAGSPWGVVYTHPDSPAFGRPPAHMAVGYEFLLDILIFGLVYKLIGKLKPEGTGFLLYLAAYSIGRFFLSFLRLDSKTVQLGLNQPQWLSLIVLVAVIIIDIRQRRSQTASD